MTPQDLQARVLYRDGSILVIDKPAGLAVHPGPSTPESLERYLGALRFGIRESPRLVHRLDRDTSGCLILARHARGASKLGRLFASAAVKKIYWAVVEGAPKAREGVIDHPLKKVTRKEGWRMARDESGQRAVTNYRLLGTGDGLSWLELAPETGRTHQLRVHCAIEGYPVLGDPVYGRSGNPGVALHLHSRAVTFPLGGGRDPVAATAPPPPHMLAALTACGWRPGAEAQRPQTSEYP
ncbi:MAG TPA: RNA pseudouridine synthase [Stellaceae bacterium]|nr:RNA pseudouridine synthase [Stellaceae bacterium]